MLEPSEKGNFTARVLVVDDDIGICQVVCDIAQGLGFQAEEATNRVGFLDAFRRLEPTVVLLDLQMPEADGVKLLNDLYGMECTASIILMSGFNSRVLKSAEKFGLSKGLAIEAAIEKPISLDLLEDLLTRVSKKASRSQITHPSPEDELTADDLRYAIENRDLFLCYQPKLAFGENGRGLRVAGAEALVRWRHERFGTIPPVRFIPFAEDVGLIAPLTEYVFKTAVAQVGQWQTGGMPLPVAVNLSPLLLDEVMLPDRLKGLAHDAGVDPKQMTIEVTESAVMRDAVDAAEILTRFRLNGFGLSIDDFGTGHSSLVELYRMPFNELKIDRLFVGNVRQSEEARVIVRSLVNLAHDLGLTACAEGAEDMYTVDFLENLSCDHVQGYAISRPKPAEEIVEFLGTWDAEAFSQEIRTSL